MQCLLVFAILLVPTTLMGGTRPILSQILVRPEGGIGRTVGGLYAVNTFGAVAGVMLAGYQLLAALGNRRTLAVSVLANVVIGAVAIADSRRLKASAPEAARQPATPLTSPAPVSADLHDAGAWLVLIALGISGIDALRGGMDAGAGAGDPQLDVRLRRRAGRLPAGDFAGCRGVRRALGQAPRQSRSR